ncbi:MAG: Uma2 family endonuclease [Acidobacteriaceae bacterium]
MATTTYIPVEQYLHSTYEPDAEYVDGEIQERSVGEFDHSAWQSEIVVFFSMHRQEWNVRAFTELRVQVAPSRFRVPDVTILENTSPLREMEQIIRTPPIAVFEILSPEDTIARTMVKLEDYEKMGIQTILVVDPKGPKYRYEHGSLELLDKATLELAGSKCMVDFGEIEKLLE